MIHQEALGIANAFICLMAAGLVFAKDRYGRLNQAFLIFSSSLALWLVLQLFWTYHLAEGSAPLNLAWTQVVYIFSLVIAASFIEFLLYLIDDEESFALPRTLNVLIGTVPALISLVPGVYATVSQHPLFQVFYHHWPSLYPSTNWFIANFMFAQVWMLLAILRKRYAMTKRRIGFVLMATFLGFIGMVVNPVAPVSQLLLCVFVITMTYAIINYKLMVIESMVRKLTVFLFMFLYVFIVFGSVSLVLQSGLTMDNYERWLWATVSSVFLIVLTFDAVKHWMAYITDRFLFQTSFDYQKLLRDASKGMSRIKSFNHLCSLVVHFITMRMLVRNAGMLTRHHGTDRFYLSHRRGYEAPPLLEAIDANDPFIRFLENEREPIDIDHVNEWLQDRNKKREKGIRPKRDYDYKVIKNRMAILRASACIPSFLGDELRNVLILGEKKSGDYFTVSDLDVLFTLAQEAAIAIENARLYDEAVTKSAELTGINKQLEIAQSKLIRALNETEMTNKRLQDTQAQLIHEQKMATLGRLASSVGHEVNNPLTILSMNVSRAILKYRKDPNLRVSEILDVFQKMEQNVGRIKAVVNTLTGLLKKSEKGKFEPLSLKLILEETLPLVQFQTYLDNLTGTDVEFDIPGNIPLVRGDLERLQEVFLNLFINAYHAMAGKRDRRIKVTAKQHESNPNMVLIEFSDNGCGMSEDVMNKIFNYGFTTKPVGKGSGMGLYMCRYIIELHGGEIKVVSKSGEGTTFVILLPVYEEESGIVGEESKREKR